MKRAMLLVGLAACAPVEGVLDVQPHAVAFSEETCITAEGRPIDIGDALTLEAWILGGALPLGATASILTLDDVAALWIDTAGTIGFSSARLIGEDGYSAQSPLWDGNVHHVAATWTATGEGAVFVDGEPIASGIPMSLDNDATSMRIGCGPGGLHYDGVIDEVRISRTARFVGAFSPDTVPYENDLDTIALWHLDTGSGTLAYEAEDRYSGVILEGEWVDGIVQSPP